jgi:sugar transferase (PEP-CTERM/EpsH1 system associated)
LNILFLTPQLPYPPRQGTAIRNWGLIKHLAERHVISLLSFTEPDQSSPPPALQAVCQQVITLPAPRRTRSDRWHTLFSTRADLTRRLWSPDFAQRLATLLSETAFDVVQVEGLELAPYLSIIKPGPTIHNPQTVYDAHNAEHLLQRRAFANDMRLPMRWPAALYSLIQTQRLRSFEARICRTADVVACVSNEDAASLQHIAPSLTPIIVPNGIDLADYQPPDSLRPAQDGIRLVFTGKMDYRPNIDAALWFIEDIFPKIRAVRPEAQFFVVGQKPPHKLQRLGGHNGVVVTGMVEDPRPYIAGAAIYVAPLRMGGGTRFKLLEAMALARPIVSTSLGAEGFAVRDGEELLLADTPAEFAAAVLKLLTSPAEAEAIARAGRAFAQASYDWSVIVPTLEAAYSRQ